MHARVSESVTWLVLFSLGTVVGVVGTLLLHPEDPVDQIKNRALAHIMNSESPKIGKMLQDIRYWRAQSRQTAREIEARRTFYEKTRKDIQEASDQARHARGLVTEHRVKEEKAAEKVGPEYTSDSPELRACKAWGQTLTQGIELREDLIKGLEWEKVQLDNQWKNLWHLAETQKNSLKLAEQTINRLEKQLSGMHRNRLRFGPGVSVGIGRSFDGRWSPQATIGVALIWGK